jgi:hypothetical protein
MTDDEIEQAAVWLQNNLELRGYKTSESKPDNWQEVGLDVWADQEHSIRFLPQDDGVRVLAYRPRERDAAIVAETVPEDASYNELAQRAEALFDQTI